MKKIILLGIMVLIIPSVLADYGHMMEYGMSSSIGMELYGIVWFVIVAFVFSLIFWSTYKLIAKDNKARRR